jgi:hypothetical protein
MGDSIEMCVKDRWWEGLGWIHLARCNEKWWAVISKIMNNTWEILDEQRNYDLMSEGSSPFI